MQGAICCQKQDFGHSHWSTGPREHGSDADTHHDPAFAFRITVRCRTESLDGGSQFFGNLGCTG
jgi:hypothetical protein